MDYFLLSSIKAALVARLRDANSNFFLVLNRPRQQTEKYAIFQKANGFFNSPNEANQIVATIDELEVPRYVLHNLRITQHITHACMDVLLALFRLRCKELAELADNRQTVNNRRVMIVDPASFTSLMSPPI